MGFRLQRSLRLGKFLQINISKSGIGLSAGLPGLKISTGPRGSFINLGLPGSGLSYRKKISGKTLGDFTGLGSAPKTSARSDSTAQAETRAPERPSPGFFAPSDEKALAQGLVNYRQGQFDEALDNFLEAADSDPGAAILAAAILAERDLKAYQPIELLEGVIETDEEFPSELMNKYLDGITINIAITPKVTVAVPLEELAAPLLLVELYQAQRRVREAIALLEEVAELSQDPVLTLSLCDLYLSREMWDEIIERAKQIEPVDDVTLQITIFFGRAMQAKEMHEAAVTVFTKALRRKQNRNPLLLQEATYWRAISYQAQGKNSRANQEFQKIFGQNPDFKDVRARLAEMSIR